MKNLLLFIAILLSVTVESQNTFPLNGNVGIGTLVPSEELEVIGAVKARNGIFNLSQPNGSVFSSYADRGEQCRVLGLGTEFSSSGSLFNFYDFPESNYNTHSTTVFGIEDRNYKSRFAFWARTNNSSDFICYDKNQSAFFKISEDDNEVTLEMANDNSYVMIGTNTYIDNGDLYKLSVNGKVRANSVKVYTDWADFVFEKNYKLPLLEEVELYIKKNGHLKDIPSENDVEQNGIELGEMNKLLLQKVEELTLYLISQNKDIEAMKIQIEKLKK